MPRQLSLAVFLLLFGAFASGCARDRVRVMEQTALRGTIPLHAVVTDFTEKRERGVRDNMGLLRIPLIYLWITYNYDRHDETYPNSTDPFNEFVAKELASRLREARVFETVTYAPADRLPQRGEYDVIISGDLNRLSRRGWKSYYGLSIVGQLFQRYIPTPHLSRYWDIDLVFRMSNAYNSSRIGEPVPVQYETSSKLQSTFANFGPIDDLKSKFTPVLDEFIGYLWEQQPPASDPRWVAIRTDGQEMIRRELAEADRVRRGAPPIFNFISPADGETVRSATVPLQWSIAAPGGLKTLVFAANNQTVDLGVSPIQMASPEVAPTSVPARSTEIPLRMGENKLEVLLTDHRGNTTTAEMGLTRLPRSLDRPVRYALLVGADSATARGAVAGLRDVLTDPLVGQLSATNVTTVSDDRLNRGIFEGVAGNFGRGPLSGQIVYIYVAAKASGEELALAGGGLPLADLVATLSRSLTTTDVVLFMDVESETSVSADLLQRQLGNLPVGWAVLATANTSGATPVATSLTEVLTSREGPRTLTLEALLDTIYSRIGAGAVAAGRYDPNIIMLERE